MPKNETKAVQRRHALFEDVAENIAHQLIEKHEFTLDKAADIGNGLADFLATHWKGQSLYIPSNWLFKNTERDQKIYERMAVGNANEIAAEFGISAVRVYQIYNRYRADQRRIHQIH